MNTTIQARKHEDCPISRLPFDTLVEIFNFATYRPLHPSSLEPSTSPPWVLSHVCSSWREASLSAPVIWSTVVITSPLPRRAPEILAEYLRRSKHHPLRVAVDAARYFKRRDIDYYDEDCRDSDVPERLVRQLAQESYRWRVVHFEMAEEMFGALAEQLDPHKLGMLQQCYVVERDIMNWNPAPKPEVAEVTASLLQAPRLRKADSRDIDLLSLSDGVGQLTHLACNMSLKNIPVLSRFANVTELHLSELYGHTVFPYPKPDILPHSVLPTLHHLSVIEPCMLTLLTAPALQSLAVREHSHYDMGGMTCCSTYTVDFLVRSSCTLEVLSLIDAEMLLKFDLDLLPVRHVKRLLFPIKDEALTRGIIEKLQGTVLPELRTITLMICTMKSKDDEKTLDEQVLDKLDGTGSYKRLGYDLVEMLDHRFHDGTLKRVRVYAVDQVWESLMGMGFRMLQNAGVEVFRDNGNGHEDTCRWWKGPHWFPVIDED